MRRNWTRWAFRALFRALAYRPPDIPVPRQGIVLPGVQVVNPGQGRGDREVQTVVVEGDQIAHIAPGDGPGMYAGSYVLPGLMDMHVHIPPPARELANLLFLAHGVTTVRETGDADGTTWRGRERIQAGEVPGPRIYASGPVLDGDPPFLPTSWTVRDAVEAREAVEVLAARGADFIKVHHKLSAPALAAIREAAAEAGLRVVGHVPSALPFEEAGVWDVQHLDGLLPYPRPGESLVDHLKRSCDLDPTRVERYVQTSARQGLVHTPTLVSTLSLIWMADPGRTEGPAARQLPRYYRDGAWSREHSPLFGRFSDEALAIIGQSLDRSLEMVRRLHRAGVRLHLGTDTAGMPFLVPGESLHRELGLMAEAGLGLEEAWMTGTRAPGESLGLPMLGTVREGAPADLLLFRADPTRDLAALSTLEGVVAQGRLYSKAFLDQTLARHRECFARPLYDTMSTALIRLGGKLMRPG